MMGLYIYYVARRLGIREGGAFSLARGRQGDLATAPARSARR